MENQTTTETKEAFNFRKYQNEWTENNTRTYRMKVNVHKDTDIMTYLDGISNVQGYLKQLIRDDIARHAQEETPHHEKV